MNSVVFCNDWGKIISFSLKGWEKLGTSVEKIYFIASKKPEININVLIYLWDGTSRGISRHAVRRMTRIHNQGCFYRETWERRSKGGSLARFAPSTIKICDYSHDTKESWRIILTTATCAQSLEFIRAKQGQLLVCKCNLTGCLIRC